MKSCLVVAATGLGKTVMMGGIAARWPTGRVMMISHRFELNQQAMRTFESICCEDVDFEQAEWRADQRSRKCRIVVASVQTLVSRSKGRRRMERFRPEDFGLLMIDEAHRAAATSYRMVVDHFARNPKCRLLGVTATPDRLDGIGLGCLFDAVAVDLNIRWAIENGWLVPVHQTFVKIDGLDLSSVRTVKGDLSEQELAKIVEQEQMLHTMGKPIADVCRDRQGIVFVVSVKQAHDLAEVIRRYGVTAEAIDGDTPPMRRKELNDKYKSGEIQVLCNVGVLGEGWDSPNTHVVAMARPTKSRALFVQAIGRGTRPTPGVVEGHCTADERKAAIAASDKGHMTVLDFVGQSGRHKLVATGDILAGSEPEEVVERWRSMARNHPDRDTLAMLAQAREEMRIEEERRRAKVTFDVSYELRDASGHYSNESMPKLRHPGYIKRTPPTDKQVAFMRRLGYSAAQIAGMTKWTARQAIDWAIENPITSTGRYIKARKRQESELHN